MDDSLVQAYARLGVHEFILEVMMASVVAALEENEAEKFLSELSEQRPKKWVAGKPAVDDETAFQIMRDYDELLKHFLTKVRHRASEARSRQ